MEINSYAVVSAHVRYKNTLLPPSVRPLSCIQPTFVKDYYVPAKFYIPNNLDFKLTVRFLVWFLMPKVSYKIKTTSLTPSLSILLAIWTSTSLSTLLPSPRTTILKANEASSGAAGVKLTTASAYTPSTTERMQNHWHPLYTWRYTTTRIMEFSQAKFWFTLMCFLAIDVVAGEIIMRIDPLVVFFFILVFVL